MEVEIITLLPFFLTKLHLMNQPKLYIGTAGWSYEDWIPSFYPFKESKEMSWLRYYSRYFNMVEVNSTFYTYLSPNIVKNWLRKIDSDNEFLFTVKLHRDFTHKRYFDAQKINLFKTNLEILKEEERLGGILIQFPYSFDCTAANVDYIRQLIEIFDGYDKYVEVRHKSWENKKAKTVTFCTIDQPQIGQATEFNPIIGKDTAYIRFHGRNEEAWLKSIQNFGKKQTYTERSERHKYLYSPGELVEISYKIKKIYDKAKKVFIVMNNYPQGYAIANAFELIRLLSEKDEIKIPSTILKAYPRLKKTASTN